MRLKMPTPATAAEEHTIKYPVPFLLGFISMNSRCWPTATSKKLSAQELNSLSLTTYNG